MVDYMNTNNMHHKHVKLSNNPQDEIYLDHTTIVRYKSIVFNIQDIIRLFKKSAKDNNNNHAAQIQPLQDIINNIDNKLKRECRHEYHTKRNGVTICTKCLSQFP